jgi:hypothetical protein
MYTDNHYLLVEVEQLESDTPITKEIFHSLLTRAEKKKAKHLEMMLA